MRQASIHSIIKKNVLPWKETDRIAALAQLSILDTPHEPDFDNIAALATLTCQSPIAAIVFFDKDRWWFKAIQGADVSECLPHGAFSTTFADNSPVAVTDTSVDDRFANAPLFPSLPGIRSFAGMPLISSAGFLAGYLFVAYNEAHEFTETQLNSLKLLGHQVTSLFELRAQVLKAAKAEEDTRSSDEQMNTIFQNSIDAVIVIDDLGRILQWNPKAQAIFGWRPEEVAGKYFAETIIHEQYREAYLAEMARYDDKALTGTTNQTIELKALRKNRTEFDIALGASPTIIRGRQFFINFISDITDRKLATESLDKQKEFYENILNKLPTDIAVFDANHQYLFVNPGAIKDPELRKYIVGKDDFQYAEHRNRPRSLAQGRRDQFLEVKRTKKEMRWEDTIKDPEGNPITHLRRLFPVLDDAGELTMVIGFGIDITDRKIMEEKQAAITNQVSEQNVQLVDFCNIVSHNLRAPLVNMSMLVDFIEESEDQEEQRMLISKLKPVLGNLHTTFNELVESIQIKQDLEIKSENVNLEHCLRHTIEGMSMEINKSEAVIEHDFGEAPNIYCPSKYLFSIFHNLVSNSLKYQSPKRKPIIKLESKKQNGTIVLSVTDNGLGIDLKRHKDNIFKIGKVFHKHPNAKGFGLFMTRTQVEAMNGRIWAESTPGEGSTFFIEFKNQK